MENNELAKQTLSEILGYYKYKVDNNLCTMAEIDSVSKVLKENMDVYGSIKDLADFYGVTENNIRVTINHKLFAKPIRKVMYPFHKFMEIVPDRWRKKPTPPQD